MNNYIPGNALIVESDRTILLEVHRPKAEAVRDAIAHNTASVRMLK